MKIGIPNPCSEDWNNMKIGIHSRFCDSCHKNVMDFTQMSRQEILEYLLSNRDKKVCGRVFLSQLDFTYSDIFVTINGLPQKYKSSNLSFYILTIGTLMLVSCSNEAPSAKQITEIRDSVSVKTDSNCISGTSDIEKNEKTEIDEIIEIAPTLGTPVFYEEMLTGDIVYEIPPEDSRVMTHPETMPEFSGGIDSLMHFIQSNIEYPGWERKRKIEGTVYVTFIVDKNGMVKNPRILKSVSESKNFDQEVLRVVQKMPKWIPGKNNGKNVDTEFNLPIVFKL